MGRGEDEQANERRPATESKNTFQLAGDILGWKRATIARRKRSTHGAWPLQHSCFDRLVRDNLDFAIIVTMLVSLDRAHDHMALLRRKTPPEKIVTFLLDIAAGCGNSTASTYDRRRHRRAGLAKETVSS